MAASKRKLLNVIIAATPFAAANEEENRIFLLKVIKFTMFVKLLFEAFEQNQNLERSGKQSLSITQTQKANKRLIVWTGILGEFDESSSL